jgi:hypothetical protein
MAEILQFAPGDVKPAAKAVLENQGIPGGEAARAEIDALCTSAMELLDRIGAPVGMFAPISQSDFAPVYNGEYMNELRTPVGDIYPKATDLALFCVTLGVRISDEITRRFKDNDFAVAAMLDSVASAAADKLAELVQDQYRRSLETAGHLGGDMAVLRYSPGYCGWHISGQGKLFDYLQPEQIGVSLSETFLMQPLKSVSGVIIAGPATIHDFPNNYSFCTMCETQGCRARIRSLLMT